MPPTRGLNQQTSFWSEYRPMQLLSLDKSLDLDVATANKYYAAHLNKYLLQVFRILGLDELDIKGGQGIEIWLNDGRTLLDFSAGIGVVGLGHNHPRIIEAERKCHERKLIDCIRVAPQQDAGGARLQHRAVPARSAERLLPRRLRLGSRRSGDEAVRAHPAPRSRSRSSSARKAPSTARRTERCR